MHTMSYFGTAKTHHSSVLLLVIQLACLLLLSSTLLQLVRSDLTVGGYNIEIGDLASKDAEVSAVAKLSNGVNQQSWWKLVSQPWHDSAIHRYFDDGPLQPAEMERLAEKNRQGSNPWVAADIDVVAEQTDLQQVLQRLSTATYKMSKTIKGTGMIHASMWTLLFKCRFTDSCDQGYILPVVTIPKDDQKQRQSQQQQAANLSTDAYAEFSYATLWVKLTTNVAVHVTPSFLGKLLPVTDYSIQVEDDPNLSIVAHVYNDSFPECSFSGGFSYRSILDAAYGLVPGMACVRFKDSTDDLEPLLLLVSLSLWKVNNGPSATDHSKDAAMITLEELISASLRVTKSDQWEIRPFGDCSTAMLLQSYQDFSKLPITMCDQHSEICILNDYTGQSGSLNGTCSGVQHLKLLHMATGQSKSCKFYINDEEPVTELPVMSIRQSAVVSCPLSSTGKVCNATIYYEDFGRFGLFSLQSDWISSDGLNTSEFRQAPHMTEFDSSQTCIRNLSSLVLAGSAQAAFQEAIQIRARSYLNSFITEHHMAFTTVNGAPTDMGSFLALIVSTALSVILATSGPLTNFFLKSICRICPGYLDSKRRCKVCKVVSQICKVGQGHFMHCCRVVSQIVFCNILLSLCTFSPVFYLAWNENEREKPFDTWDLASGDQNIYNSFGDAERLRVVYLLSASSTYNSNFIIASTLVVGITCLIVGICSGLRCKEVLNRYTLLQTHDSILAGNGRPADTGANNEGEDKKTLRARALRAINMAGAEYATIKTEVDRCINVPSQELTALNPAVNPQNNQQTNAHTGTHGDRLETESSGSRLLSDSVRSV